MLNNFLTSRWILFALSVTAGLAVIAIAAVLLQPPPDFAGSVIDPAPAAPEIALTDQAGRPFRLSETGRRATLLFFGYTYCPDACPATLAQFQSVKKTLGAQAEQVRFVLVTVDPLRDTPARLAEYLSAFDADFIGLTGSEAEMTPVWKNYGIFRELLSLDGAPMGQDHSGHDMGAYQVDHTTRIFAVDAEGRLRVTYTIDVATSDLAADVRRLLP